MPTLGFRLVIRDAADDADEFIVSSVPGGANPYLTEPPSVDGASGDLLAGTIDVGAGTVRFWDELTTVENRLLAVDDFESYIGGSFTGGEDGAPTALIRPGRWSRHGHTELTGQVNAPAFTFDGVRCYSVAWDPSPDLVSGDSYIQRSDWSEFALPANTGVLVRVWTYPGTFMGHDQEHFENYPQVGLEVEGAGVDRDATRGFGDPPPPPVEWWPRICTGTTRSDATLDVRLGHFDFVGVGSSRDMSWDRVEIWSAEEGRIMTGGLYQLVDEVPRIALLSRKARIEQTTDGGETWTAYHRGHLNRLEVDGGEWTVTVGDTTRQEQQTELFATLPTLNPSSVGLPIPMPRVGLILGGPIASDATYGKFANINDFGPTRWKVEETLLDAAGDDRLVRLKFVSGYLRPWFDTERFWFKQDEWEKINNAGRDYFVWDPAKYESHPYPLSTVNSFGYFPDLVARLDPVGGGSVLEKMPIARPVKHEPDDKHKPKAEFSALTGNDSVLYVDWGPDDPFPAVDDQYDVTLYSPVISEKNPLLLAGHPVDLVAYAASLSGIPWNAASRVSARAALGAGLWYECPAAGVTKFADFQKQLGGFFGFYFRPDLTTGERHFIPTRVRPAASQFLITNAIRIDATDGSGDGQPVVWAAEEDSVVNIVVFATQRFRVFRYKEDEGDPPITMLAAANAEVTGKRGDTTVNGERTIRYEIPGQVQRRAADGGLVPLILVTRDPANPGYAEDAGGVIVDFAGWGVAESVVLVDAADDAASAQVGDEGTVDLPDLPVPRVGLTPLTQRGIGPRVVRVKKRDPQIGAVQFTLVHAGELSQGAITAPTTGSADPGTPIQPTFTLTLHPAYPTQLALITFTNGAALAADNLITQIEQLNTAPSPSNVQGTGLRAELLYEDGDATTRDSFVAGPGGTMWLRMRSLSQALAAYSDWTDWQSYTTPTVENGGGPGGGPDGGPGGGAYVPTLSVTAVADFATGDVTATATASANAVSVKFAIGPVGGTPPSLADVRAATADSAAPFASGMLATLALGEVRTVGALAYDAVGNESAMATDKVAVGAELAAIPFDLNLGELGDGTNDLTTGEREFVAIVSVEGTVEGWTCDGDVGAVTLDVETAPVVSGVDFVWTTRCTTGSDQRPAFSGTAPTSVTLTGANEFALTGRTAIRITVASASGGATVTRLAFHGTRS